MASVQISSQEVFQYSNQLSGLNHQMQSIFEEIKARMHQIESIWQSPASRVLMEQFSQMHPVFEAYVEALEQYSVYLNQTALSYQENEQILSQGIKV